MFDSQRTALAVSRTPWLAMEGARNLSDGQAFQFFDLDLAGEDLAVFFSLAPGRAVIGQATAIISVAATDWGTALTPCNRHKLPCGSELTDAVNVSTVDVAWAASSFANVPEASVPNDVVPLYLELRRTDGTGPRIAGGVFYLTETNLNGDA